MAKKTADPETLESNDPTVARPRLNKLIVKNFRCIGATPVEIELDEIVVLVGPNNAGKSSILRAYEVVMSHGSKEGHLTLDDFPNRKIDPDALPEIELHTVVYDNSPGDDWIHRDDKTGEMFVREKWTWSEVGAPKRQGFDKTGKWSDKVPWGAPNVANSRRPLPHKVDAFADPETQAKEIISLLMSVLTERLKGYKNTESNEEEKSEYELLLEKVVEIQKKILDESHAEIKKVESEISDIVGKVFPGYVIHFDARPEDEIEKTVNFFKANPQLLMGPEAGFKSTIDRQGSGARRTLLWAALRHIAEHEAQSKGKNRPHVLMLDEPELCLHPTAVRDACKVLYDLPKTGNWQVMVTTHSPTFIDVSRDNKTIIRVDRNPKGEIQGTTLFRPKRAKLDDEDRENLKLMNIYDPYVAEFFFGGRTVIVEGDTEYTAFKQVISKNPDEFGDVHIIRARGKATVASLVKILNHFGSNYAVLHDSDFPKTKRKDGTEMTNPAWTNNTKILDAVLQHEDKEKVRLLASLPNFEGAYFGEEASGEKPYNALVKLQHNEAFFRKVEDLLRALVDPNALPPEGCIEWRDSGIEALRAAAEQAKQVLVQSIEKGQWFNTVDLFSLLGDVCQDSSAICLFVFPCS